jgi:hypothetical protein
MPELPQMRLNAGPWGAAWVGGDQPRPSQPYPSYSLQGTPGGSSLGRSRPDGIVAASAFDFAYQLSNSLRCWHSKPSFLLPVTSSP